MSTGSLPGMTRPADIWKTLDSASDSYAARNGGTLPDRLHVGAAVALVLRSPEEATLDHPLHLAWVRKVPPLDGHTGAWFPAPPQRLGWFRQRRREHACARRGGHWYHPADAAIAWFCCSCGRERDGMVALD